MVRFIWLIVAVFVMIGCARFQMPEIKFNEMVFAVSSKNGLSRLYVSNSDESYNFTLTNSFGVPIAKRVLNGGRFKSVGFLPNQSAYDELFYKTLKMIEIGLNEDEILIKNEKFKVTRVDIY